MVPRKASFGELSSYAVARSTVKGVPLTDEELRKARIHDRENPQGHAFAEGTCFSLPRHGLHSEISEHEIDAVLRRRYLESCY
jgi:hypothetical protein